MDVRSSLSTVCEHSNQLRLEATVDWEASAQRLSIHSSLRNKQANPSALAEHGICFEFQAGLDQHPSEIYVG